MAVLSPRDKQCSHQQGRRQAGRQMRMQRTNQSRCHCLSVRRHCLQASPAQDRVASAPRWLLRPRESRALQGAMERDCFMTRARCKRHNRLLPLLQLLLLRSRLPVR